MAKKQEARRAHLQSYVDRFRYKADKARQAQSRLKALARMQPITSPQEAGLRRFDFPSPTELSPPIINMEGVSTGYGENVILDKLSLRIDQDDRIALLGKNGQGKSTLSKLLSDRLPKLSGRMTVAAKLRVGYFAQHQVDELVLDETPLEHLRRERPDEEPKRLRARLAGFGLTSDQADTTVAQLSGGQKARLSLLLATLDAPHLLILDEPTNHLDIESREALVEALTAYSGAVILVSHDMHLLELVADRLWLVSGGTVRPFEGDLEAYRAFLLDQKPAKPPADPKPKRPSRDVLAALRSDVRKAESRIEKLSEMHQKLSEKLGDASLYDDDRRADLEVWQAKFSELEVAMDRAEALWVSAQEALDAAEKGAG
jgi:ATP-binding cassette subfamily F protein 3